MKKKYSIDKIGLYTLLGLLGLLLVFGLFVGGSADDYNSDMDITRLRDLREIGTLVEEYKTKTGAYPLASDSNIPTFVPIVTRKQKKYTRERPKARHSITSVKDFIKVLEKGLGRRVMLPFDPQLRTSKRPIFYLYVIKGTDYELIAHLYHDYPFARKIKKHYSKVTVSNRAVKPLKIWKYSTLMASTDFRKAADTPLIKPSFIKKLRRDIRKEGAF